MCLLRRTARKPGADADEVHCRGRKGVLQVCLSHPDVAGAPEVRHPNCLRDSPLHPGPSVVLSGEVCACLTISCGNKGLMLVLWPERDRAARYARGIGICEYSCCNPW